MKKLLLLFFLLAFSLQAEATLPVTDQNLEAAIMYGKSYQGEKNSPAMLVPWEIVEQFKANPYQHDERIIIYTPYLLAALDAAAKTPTDDTSVEAAKTLVSRYEGVLVVRAMINAPLILKEKDLDVQIVQNGKFILPYHNEFLDGKYLEKTVAKPITNAEVQKRMVAEDGQLQAMQKVCQVQYNFYFDQAELDVAQPYLLIIKDEYCGSREFSVEPGLLK